jgi:hypothetical protein
MIKLDNNWRHKTLENLENDFWGEPSYDSYLVRRTHEIRKFPLADLTNDDIAMMVRQKFSLDYMVPLAIDKLQVDILAHGDAGVEGAILDAVLKIPPDFWKSNKEYWKTIKKLLEDNETVVTFKRRDYFDNAISS